MSTEQRRTSESAGETAAYRSEDRSILLPYYKAWIVDPSIKRIPASVSPNAITLLGTVLSTIGAAICVALRPTGGPIFLVVAVLLWAYIYCDNADGGHARRTGQTSALGETLDHGLDLLNVAYVGVMTVATLGAPASSWVSLMAVITLAASVVYWEQAEVGVFRLGLLNQLESATVLTILMVIVSLLGTSAMHVEIVGPITTHLAVLVWTLATIFFGIARGLVRVARKDPRAVFRVMPLFLVNAAMTTTFSLGHAETPLVVCAVSAQNVGFGARMLAARLGQRAPEPAAGLAALAAATLAAAALGPSSLATALAWLVLAHGVVVAMLGADACARELKRAARLRV